MARKASRKHGSVDYGSPNLIPIMSVFVILIPLLIYTFTFFEIKITKVAAPRIGSGKAKSNVDNTEKPLNLTVIISKKGFMVKMDPSLAEKENKKSTHKIPMRDFVSINGEKYADYDFPTLYAYLADVKKTFPKEENVNIGAAGNEIKDIKWDTISRTIDCVRMKLEQDKYEGLKEWATAKIAQDKNKVPEILFKNIVFVVVD